MQRLAGAKQTIAEGDEEGSGPTSSTRQGEIGDAVEDRLNLGWLVPRGRPPRRVAPAGRVPAAFGSRSPRRGEEHIASGSWPNSAPRGASTGRPASWRAMVTRAAVECRRRPVCRGRSQSGSAPRGSGSSASFRRGSGEFGRSLQPRLGQPQAVFAQSGRLRLQRGEDVGRLQQPQGRRAPQSACSRASGDGLAGRSFAAGRPRSVLPLEQQPLGGLAPPGVGFASMATSSAVVALPSRGGWGL